MPIKRLSVQLANQIAAGEVVERPSSVVKELVENAVDACATIITLEIRGSGKQLIKVTDNGKGIPEDELALALAPHATSKIACLEDLAAIVTMGFRGEALASIASVSRLTLTSRTAEQPHACQVEVSGPEQNPVVAPAAHPVGTTVTVSDLFFNTPARRHFLKSDKTEFNHIKDLMIRLALVNYGIEFKFISDGKTVLHVPAQSRARLGDRIASLLGREFKSDVLRFDNGDSQYVNAYRRYLNLPPLSGHSGPVGSAAAPGGRAAMGGASGGDWDDGLVPDDRDPLSRQILSIYGVLVKPQSFTRATQDRLLTFLNGRCIADRTVNHAIREAYLNAVQQDLDFKPCIRGVIFMECDPRTVDVNVHPRKDEVRFHNASIIHDCILANVKSVFELNDINRDNARMGRLGVDDMACVDHRELAQGISPEETVRRRRESLGSQRSLDYARQVQDYLNNSLRPLHPLPADPAAAAAVGRLCDFGDLLNRAEHGRDNDEATAAITAIRHGTAATTAAPAAAAAASPAGGIWSGSLIDDEYDILPKDGAPAAQSAYGSASAAAAASTSAVGIGSAAGNAGADDEADLFDDEVSPGPARQGAGAGALPGPRIGRPDSAFTLDFLLQTQERERITRMLNAAAGKSRAGAPAAPEYDAQQQIDALPDQAAASASTDAVDQDFLSSAQEALSWADQASGAPALTPDTAAPQAAYPGPEAEADAGADANVGEDRADGEQPLPRGLVFDSALRPYSQADAEAQAHSADATSETAAEAADDSGGAADAAVGAAEPLGDSALHRSMMTDAGAGAAIDTASAAAAAGSAAGALQGRQPWESHGQAAGYSQSRRAAHVQAADSRVADSRARVGGDSPWSRGRSEGGYRADESHVVPGMQRMSADEVSALMSMQGKCQFQSLVTADVALMNIGSRYFMVRCSELYYSRTGFEYARDVSQDQVSAQELPMPFAIRCDSTLVQAFRALDAVAAAARCGFTIKAAPMRSSIEINAIPRLAVGCNLASVALEALQIIALAKPQINAQAQCPESLSGLLARCRSVAINTAYDARNLIEDIDSMLSLREAAQNGALMEISLLDMARVLLGSQS